MLSLTVVCALQFAPLAVQDPEEAAAGSKATIGDLVPDYDFRVLTGGDGRHALHELRGRPVLIVNWTDTDFGRGASNKTEKLAKQLVPKGLVSILLDTHNKKQEEIEASAMRLYPGNRSWLSRNQKVPIAYLDNGPPPDIALVGVDGRLLLAGSYTADYGKVAKLVKAELKKLKTGWGEHEAARQARALAFGSGELAEARATIAGALAGAPTHAELLAVRDEITTRHRTMVEAVAHYRETGEYVLAMSAAEALKGAADGDAEWGPPAAELCASFTSAEAQRELELEATLTRLTKSWAKKEPKAADVKKLRKLAQDAGDSSVGKRAAHLAKIAELAIGKK